MTPRRAEPHSAAIHWPGGHGPLPHAPWVRTAAADTRVRGAERRA